RSSWTRRSPACTWDGSARSSPSSLTSRRSTSAWRRPAPTSPTTTGTEAGARQARPEPSDVISAARLRRLAALALLLAAAPAGAEAGHPLTLWRVDGVENRVYLLGSVHLLRPEDHPLPAGIEDAYHDADTLVMEMDVDDV